MIVNTGFSLRAPSCSPPGAGKGTPAVLRVSQAGRMTLAQVFGPCDAENTPRILAQLVPLAGPSRRIVLDLRRAEFVDSAGIRGLLGLQTRLEQAGAELRLVTPSEGQVRKTLAMLKLDGRFEIFGSVVDAWITRWSDRRDARSRPRQAAA